MPGKGDELPTIAEVLSQWLGVQLPTVRMPQTLKNLDKAFAKIVYAGGENLETRIRENTNKTKARGKIDLEGMYRTEEEKRKLENKVAAAQAAIEELEVDPGSISAAHEIEDDWLNLFARLAEDKSSETLRRLFGKVLAGEVKKPGSFSLRTIQLLATISKSDADLISQFLSYELGGHTVPFATTIDSEITPTVRLMMEELDIAGHPTMTGGMTTTLTVHPNKPQFIRPSIRRPGIAILVNNKTEELFLLHLHGQILSSIARELIPIANSPPARIEFYKEIAHNLYNFLNHSPQKKH
jgi:hypothetical protein